MAFGSRRVPVRYFLLLIEGLHSSGIDVARLLEMAGLQHAQFQSRESMLTSLEVDAFILAASRISGRTDLGFEMGRRIKMNSHDLLGYGLMSCPSMDAFLRMTSRHYHLMVETWTMSYRRDLRCGECVYTPTVALPPHSMSFYLEALAVAHQNQMQLVLGSHVMPYDIYISMPVPEHIQRYMALYPVNFRFESSAVPGVRAVMPNEMLDIPLALGDEAVMREIDERCRTIAQKPPRGDVGWTDYVLMVLREARGTQVAMEDIAQRVQVSARTIDRHLKKEGLGFRELSEKVRFERACEMLCSPGATVADVALKLGFSDAQNLSRAFKRVMGVTPSDYQKKSQIHSNWP